MNDFKFDPVQLMLKVNDHSNKLEHLEEMLRNHVDEDQKNFAEVRARMERLAEATEKLDDTIDKFVNQTKGAQWAAAKLWALVLAVASLSFTAAKYIKFGG